MKFSVITFAATALAACTFEAGNYYCGQVDQVVYTNVGGSGSYQAVTSYGDASCGQASQGYSGPLAPFDEDLSIHFRGPISLKQVAVYYPGGASGPAKRQVARAHHEHKREPIMVTDVVHVTVTIDGEGQPLIPVPTPSPELSSEVSSAETSSSVAAPETSSTISVALPETSSEASSSVASSPEILSSTSSASPVASGSAWTRSAYYDSASGTADGLIFFNNLGGAGSGVWTAGLGNSISFAGPDGTSCASSPQVLEDKTFASNQEFMIFSATECGNDCGVSRPGIPAYKGFAGTQKVFLFEFAMPHDSACGSGFNCDMPAVWMLNAQIPRNVQYGPASCSCWANQGGCGELDLFEVLTSGFEFLTNHIHSAQGSGSSSYIQRPSSGTLKAAVVFDTDTIKITTLDSSVSFDGSLSQSTIDGWFSQTAGSVSTVALS